MQFLLMIYSDEKIGAKMSEEQSKDYIAAYNDFTQGIVQAKQFVAGDALMPVATAQTVSVKDGKVTRTDGPFAETREQLGGYYLVEAKDIDEACEIAAKIPTAKHGLIEVRPIMTW